MLAHLSWSRQPVGSYESVDVLAGQRWRAERIGSTGSKSRPPAGLPIDVRHERINCPPSLIFFVNSR